MSRTFQVYPAIDPDLTVNDLMEVLDSFGLFDPAEIAVYHDGKQTAPDSFGQVSLNIGLTCMEIADGLVFIDFHRWENHNYWCIESRALEGIGRSLFVAAACAIANLTDGIVNSGDGAWEHAGDYHGAELWQAYLTEELPFDYPRERFFCPAMHEEVFIQYTKVQRAYTERCVEAVKQMSGELFLAVCEAAKRYALWMYAQYESGNPYVQRYEVMGDTPLVTPETPADQMAPDLFNLFRLVIDPPEDESHVCFQLEGECEWAYKSRITAKFQDGRLVYLGIPDEVNYPEEHPLEKLNFA